MPFPYIVKESWILFFMLPISDAFFDWRRPARGYMMSHVHLWSWSYTTCLGFQLSSPARALQPHDLMIGNLIKLYKIMIRYDKCIQVYTNIATCSVYSFDYSILLKQTNKHEWQNQDEREQCCRTFSLDALRTPWKLEWPEDKVCGHWAWGVSRTFAQGP